MYKICRKCRSTKVQRGIYCELCKQDLISANVASKILDISLSKFIRLVDQYPNSLKKYNYRSQIKYSHKQVLYIKNYKPINKPIKGVQWSPYYLKCRKCKSTNYQHISSGLCSSCYSTYLPKWSDRFKACTVCKGTDNKHIIAGYCEECYKKTKYYYSLLYYQKGLTFKQIGGKLGITKERARQLIHKSLTGKIIMTNPQLKSEIQYRRKVNKGLLK